MKLIYTGDFERLKDFGYDYESVLEVYYKMIIPQKWKIPLFNEMSKARVINIAKDKKIITKKMDNWLDWNERETLKKDVKDLIQAGLVRKEENENSK